MRRKLIRMSLIIGFPIYCLLYWNVRENHYIVHAYSHLGVGAMHLVRPGHYGVGRGGAFAPTGLYYLLFYPLAKTEELCWNIFVGPTESANA